MHSMDSLSDAAPDARLSSPAAQRNREPILAVLREVLPAEGRVLEIASGTGEHIVHFARHLAELRWQPSDPSPEARRSIEAWRQATNLDNLDAPLALDVTQRPWPADSLAEPLQAIVCLNMIHIAPWEATQALLVEAGRRLSAQGVLFLYGPFKRQGTHSAPSNAAFDADLRQRNPAWGVRDLDDVTILAQQAGLYLERIVEMPANNLSVVLRRELD
ncbi:DUF938 domain-containing protein [Halomonas sp. WWR20]